MRRTDGRGKLDGGHRTFASHGLKYTDSVIPKPTVSGAEYELLRLANELLGSDKVALSGATVARVRTAVLCGRLRFNALELTLAGILGSLPILDLDFG